MAQRYNITKDFFVGDDKKFRFRISTASGQVLGLPAPELQAIATSLPSIVDDEYQNKNLMIVDGNVRGFITEIISYQAYNGVLTLDDATPEVVQLNSHILVLENITDWPLTFTLITAPGVTDNGPIITKEVGDGIALIDPNSGLFELTLDAADTENLEARTYWYEIRRTDSGEVTVLIEGDLVLQKVHEDLNVPVYANNSELRMFLKIASNLVNNQQLDMLLENASRQIEDWCGRKFYVEARDQSRYFNGSGDDEIDIGDCLAITAFEIDENDDGVYEISLAEGADYVTYPFNPDNTLPPIASVALRMTGQRWIIWGDSEVRGFIKNVRVTGDWGFCTDDTRPRAIKQACIMQAARWYKRAETAFATTTGNFQQGSINVYKGIDPDVEQLIKPFKRLNIGYV